MIPVLACSVDVIKKCWTVVHIVGACQWAFTLSPSNKILEFYGMCNLDVDYCKKYGFDGLNKQ